jgi:hypothetical protein
MEAARHMNPPESEKPDKNPSELSTDTASQLADKRAFFPEFVKLEEGDEFNTVDYRHCDSGSYLDLEITYITWKIWEQKSLWVSNWRRLSELEALTLAQFTGDLTIDLGDEMEPELQMHLCRVLAEHRGTLFLFGSIGLTPEAATALLQHPGAIIANLDNLDFSTANILKTHHDIEIISDFWSS